MNIMLLHKKFPKYKKYETLSKANFCFFIHLRVIKNDMSKKDSEVVKNKTKKRRREVGTSL